MAKGGPGVPSETVTRAVSFNGSRRCALSVHLDASKFSFSVCGPVRSDSLSFFRGRIRTSLSLATGLGRTFHRLSFLGRACGQMGVLVTSGHFALVPLRLFRSSRSRVVFCRGRAPGRGRAMGCGVLGGGGTMIVFNVSGDAYRFLSSRCPRTEFCSRTTPLTRCFSTGDELNGDGGVCTSVHHSTVSFFYCRHKRLLLTGSFRYHGANSQVCCLLCL